MSHFRVRVQARGVEIEVDSSDKDYTESKVKELMAAFGPAKGTASEPRGSPSASRPRPSGGKPTSIVEYVRSLAPKSGTQYVVAVGDYLERHGGMSDGFRTRDVVEGFRAMKYKHANPAEAVRSAKQQGFLMDGKESGTMVVTQTGEAWVKGQLAGGEDAA
jgi:hypothetical protein